MRTLIDLEYRAQIRTKPCVVAVALGRVTECLFLVQFCHLDHSGMGGKDVPDRGNGFPGCVKHHDEYHAHGRKAFEAKYGDLQAVCELLWHEYIYGVQFPDEPWGTQVAQL